MKLFVGLGNPGSKYARHRHNIGFMAIDALAQDLAFPKPKARFQGEATEGALPLPGGGQDKVLLLKPQTYMNESGRSVGEAARFFRIDPGDVFVFHDELDLAAGKVRIKCGGGNAGHNGLKSITAHLGNDYWRVRLGIGHPGDKDRVAGHVLGDFSGGERDGWLRDLLDGITREIGLLATGETAQFATRLAEHMRPPQAAPGGRAKDE